VRRIKLSNGKCALVDNKDFEHINEYCWEAHRTPSGKWYARRVEIIDDRRVKVWMHRLIIDVPAGMETDHRNGNGLDNRRKNIRACTRSQNRFNKRPTKHSSKYKGVSWVKSGHKWRALISLPGRLNVMLGYFKDERKAALAYDVAARKYFGAFAYLNFPIKKPRNTALCKSRATRGE